MRNSTATLRILIVADDLLARAGLSALLADQPGCTIVGQAAGSDDLAAVVDATRPEVLLWDLGRDPEDALERLDDARDRAAAIVALLPDGTSAADALAAGARGLAPRDAAPETLAAVALAVGNGLIAIHPTLGAFLPAARAEPAAPPVEPLSERESEVLSLLGEGMANKEIADRLGISEHTVRFHVRALLGKLGTQNRTEAVVRAVRLGLLTL
ncbi:MAG TPA: response regulator transcription factor [bacterium]|nr:response regulator transcription factor [bacterium]